MTTANPAVFESLTYWHRLEDILPYTPRPAPLTAPPRRGLNRLQDGGDMAAWVRESESLLRDVDERLRYVGAAAPELLDIGRAAPAVESLRSVLSALHSRSPAGIEKATFPPGPASAQMRPP
jgi:hypothetical protein